MYKAVGGNVVIKTPKEIVRKSEGGLILVDNAMDNPHKAIKATVVDATGNSSGLSNGDVVLLAKHSAVKIGGDDEYDYQTVKESAIVAVVEE